MFLQFIFLRIDNVRFHQEVPESEMITHALTDRQQRFTARENMFQGRNVVELLVSEGVYRTNSRTKYRLPM